MINYCTNIERPDLLSLIEDRPLISYFEISASNVKLLLHSIVHGAYRRLAGVNSLRFQISLAMIIG